MMTNNSPVWLVCHDGHSELCGMIMDLVPVGELIGYNGKIHLEFETEAGK